MYYYGMKATLCCCEVVMYLRKNRMSRRYMDIEHLSLRIVSSRLLYSPATWCVEVHAASLYILSTH